MEFDFISKEKKNFHVKPTKNKTKKNKLFSVLLTKEEKKNRK